MDCRVATAPHLYSTTISLRLRSGRLDGHVICLQRLGEITLEALHYLHNQNFLQDTNFF